jgi:hypothetical protein
MVTKPPSSVCSIFSHGFHHCTHKTSKAGRRGRWRRGWCQRGRRRRAAGWVGWTIASWVFCLMGLSSGWWFGTWIFFFHNIWDNHNPNWLIFLKMVKPTNQVGLTWFFMGLEWGLNFIGMWKIGVSWDVKSEIWVMIQGLHETEKIWQYK